MLFITASCSLNAKKQIVGETTRILVAEAKNNYLARIDTGARVTPIHAINVTVPGLAIQIANGVALELRLKLIEKEKNVQRTAEERVNYSMQAFC